MSRRRSRASSAEVEALRRVLMKRRKNWRWASLLLVALAAGSSVCSRVKAPEDARPADGTRVRVVRVVDGDILIVSAPAFSGQERLRLRGIDAPELAHDGKPVAFFAEESKDYLARRLAAAKDGSLILQFDGTETRDRYGRLLGFVYLTENDCLNLAMVRDGYAYADRRFDSYLKSELGRAEGDARKRKRGLWKDVTVDQMPQWRQSWLARQSNAN